MGLLLSPDHSATLTDPETWKDNPFVMRDMRRDIKKRQPFISFCWMCGILGFLAPWAASVIWQLQTSNVGLPVFVTGDIGTALAVIISGVHIWFIVGASKKHTNQLFTEESNQNTLGGLLMLPTSAFQILVQTMAYPWLVAMRMAFALLPVYVFCVAIDGPSPLEILSLYLVYAMAALTIPRWNQPALSENTGILASPIQNGLSWFGRDSATAKSVGTSGRLLFRLLAVPVILSWISAVIFGGMSAGKALLSHYIPYSIINMLPAIPVSWPIILARLMITPLDWFGMQIVPIVFVIVLFAVGKYLQLVRASEFLSVGAFRDLPLQSTYLPRIRLAAATRTLLAFAITGYLWKPFIVDGGLTFAGPTVAGSDPGLGGLAFMLLLYAAIWAQLRGAALGQWQHRPLIRGERSILCRNSTLDGVRYLCEPFGFAIAFYLLCCLFGRCEPFPSIPNSAVGSVGGMLLQGTLIGLSGAVLSFGVSRLFGSTGILLRVTVPALVGFGIIYTETPGMQSLLGSIGNAGKMLSFIPNLKRFEIFSPLLGILHVGSTNIAGTQRFLPGTTPPIVWIATCLILGSAMWLTAHLFDSRREQPNRDVVTLVYNPTVLGREAFSDPDKVKRLGLTKTDTPFVVGAIARIQRVWDNAVLTRELRSRLRGQWDTTVICVVLCISLAVTVVFFHPLLALFPSIFGRWLAFLLMGTPSGPVAATAAGILGCWYLGLFISAVVYAFVTTGAFFTETQKSTLGFLLSTPMSSQSIVLGKAAGILGPSTGILGAMSLWTLILTVIFLPLLGPAALLGWFYAVFTAITFYLMVNSVSFTISAMFPKLSMSGSVWVWILLFWFGTWPMAWVFGLLALPFFALGLQAASIWYSYITVAWLVISIGYVISVSSVQSMRRRDLAYEPSKRSN